MQIEGSDPFRTLKREKSLAFCFLGRCGESTGR